MRELICLMEGFYLPDWRIMCEALIGMAGAVDIEELP